MKLGARIFKTGLAVTLAMYAALWLGSDSATFAAIAAAFAIQPSIHRTFQTILDQIQANLIGAILAVIFVLTFGHDPFVVGVVVILAIAIISKLKLEPSTIPLAIVTIIIIMESPTTNFVEFATDRFLLIMLGVFTAFIVNLFFIPPRYETKFYQLMLNETDNVIQWIMLLLRQDADPRSLKDDLERLDGQVKKLDNLYSLYKEERNYFLKNKYSKARKLVLFRQMLITIKKSIFVLKNFERRSDDIKQLPEPIQQQFEQQLDLLTNFHNRILLRYVGKVTSSPSQETLEDLDIGKASLAQAFITYYNQEEIEEQTWMHTFPAISQIIEYQEELVHLDHLVNSFFKYHTEESTLDINPEE
ncbi:membrane protein [Alkalihalobacillus alcalophilus ATCC 27647 = CGMCC 1.3604]|uniref:Membrane protein n=2 Tax=Alkalihalobacillus alcalophilus ATCC 27647 = CGMCC 1.3604 TaxID=1218173 RepID=A0A094WNZ5_ALKAL|nr:aromatic acid exporter family protein [Alkalihalobacillus alcalophilus]KGA97683.1 membrane protein [Alkalihalobacillus alcalophilus ATCC 27647 = CGMCC 1.3604]MED1562557.1 aromatic acid exporter family protein [Alkalihalobacillus alcalophilus]THG91286.1 membrane protein [Alkalihalobacillus alcalophilus ATCC 27647 = CGMCC 1.3604]